jgi:hypothetical protein
MIRYSALQQRPRQFGSEYADFTYFDAVETLFAKLQFHGEWNYTILPHRK